MLGYRDIHGFWNIGSRVMAILGYREGGRSAQSLSLFSQGALFVYIMHLWWQYHIGKLKWDRFGEDAVPYPSMADQKNVYGDWCAASVSQYKDGELSRKDLGIMASRVWVLQFLVQRAQQGFFTMDGKPVFQVGPEKHQWPSGGKSPPAKIAMSLLSFGQKVENQPSQDLLRFVAANWRAVVGYAFHPPTSSRGMMRVTNPHDIPAPYATQPPYTLQLPPPRTSTHPRTFRRTFFHATMHVCPPCAQAVRSSVARDGQPKTLRCWPREGKGASCRCCC